MSGKRPASTTPKSPHLPKYYFVKSNKKEPNLAYFPMPCTLPNLYESLQPKYIKIFFADVRMYSTMQINTIYDVPP